MAGLPKKYFKMFPGQLKKAWAKYKADKGEKKAKPAKKEKTSKPRKVKHKRAVVRDRVVVAKVNNSQKLTGKRKGSKMAKTKKTARKIGGKLKAGMNTKPGQLLTMAVIASAGGVATSLAINKTPKIKDLSQPTKSAIQAGLGLLAIFFGQKKLIKSMGAGAVIASVFALTKSITKIDPLAGPGSQTPTLSPAQMARLLSMNAPASVRMNAPASVRMNAPASVSMGGTSPVKGWQQGGWGSNW